MFAKPLSKIFVIFFLLVSSSAVAGKLEIHDAWAREAPPAAKVMAAYFTLHNHSARAHTLTSLSSTNFKQVEMHRTEQHDDMSKMIPVSRVILSPKGSVSFQPGGMHLMLMGPKKQLEEGDKITLTLFFIDKSSIQVSLPVKKATAKSGHDKHNDSHQH